jgi:hypothetical protein
MNPPNIILALASKQIWPHVLTLTRYRPKRLILLHSEEGEESQEPARRLQALVTRGSNLGVADVSLEKISYDNFDAVKQRLDILFTEKQLSRETTAINFTGSASKNSRHSRRLWLTKVSTLPQFRITSTPSKPNSTRKTSRCFAKTCYKSPKSADCLAAHWP